ncbi:alpha/beta-hydrolase [Annulohypoxylon bovei var. microspora]|nr:alpha/beta-hydrolase [Annulohypoxylon bovei var. microspora]
MSRHLRALLVLAALSTPLVANPLYNSSILWKDCPTELTAPGSKVRCGYLAVPLDWESPRKGNINIALAKLPARKPENRIGNLFYQPGGPGIQGTLKVAHVETGEVRWGEDLLDHFDLISVDVRGTGLSNPLDCDPDLYNQRLPAYPLTDAEFAARVKRNHALRQSCLDRTGIPLIDYMDTITIAKDHEAVRVALGGEPMNWFGVSYGTLLGSQYAELFPNNIRSMIIDGVVSLSQPEVPTFAIGASAVDVAFKGFLSWCALQNATGCPMAHYDSAKSLEEIWMDLMARIQEKPLSCNNTKLCPVADMTVDEVRSHALGLLYTNGTFPYLAEAIGHALDQYDASVFSEYTTLLSFPSAIRNAYNNSAAYSNLAIVCQDWYHNDQSAVDIKLKHTLALTQTPLMMGFSPTYRLFQVNCIGWPAPTRNPPHRISIPRTPKLPTILMVDSLRDPATSLAWGTQLREEIGRDRTVMIAKNMTGHAVYEQPDTVGGEIAAAMEQYLVKLALPEDGKIFQS